MGVFERYAPFIQDFIYDNSWQQLRSVQVAAGDVIFNSDENLLLCAGTASGKTEAAFFPILTLFNEDMPKSIGAIYIGPLKALINDQFSRLNDLCKDADIPVWHWHGDVSQTQKEKCLKNPSGILQITPESLEALLMHKHSYISRLFCDLRFIVIDEVHSLLRGDRGGQTMCLIERLSHIAGVIPRRIGLSATVGDIEKTAEFLALGTGRRTIVPEIAVTSSKWRISMEHFYISKKDQEIDEDINEDKWQSPLDIKTDDAPKEADPGLGYIYEHTRNKKCLVFVNSREEAETVTATLRQYCEINNDKDRFLIHHGNLSASYRETAEAIMKDDEEVQTTVTTATLELGIDIGRLERAFQIDAPATVSSFLQRLGRTGRRDLPPEMWFVMREDEPEARAMLPETIPWKLLQGIALLQLYIEEKWVEPTKLDRLPYSLLYHQTMATLASCGELSPSQLASKVLSLPVFYKITQEDYKILLRHLIDIDHIQRTEEGGMIVGLGGERIINSFKFYAVFQENEEYTVRSESSEIGTIVKPPPPGDKIAIAGHVWVVDEVDHKKHVVYCTQVKGIVPAFFGLCPGDIHTKILKKMRTVLEEDKQYPYLMKNAFVRLNEAKQSARISSLTKKPLINLGGDMWCLFPWIGTYAFFAMERFLKIKCADKLTLKGLNSSRPYFIQFTMKASAYEFYSILKEEANKDFDPMSLIYPKENPIFEKYDEYVPRELVCKGFAYGVLDIKGMVDCINSWDEGCFIDM